MLTRAMGVPSNKSNIWESALNLKFIILTTRHSHMFYYKFYSFSETALTSHTTDLNIETMLNNEKIWLKTYFPEETPTILKILLEQCTSSRIGQMNLYCYKLTNL